MSNPKKTKYKYVKFRPTINTEWLCLSTLGEAAQEAVDEILGEQKEVRVLRLAHPAAFWKSNNPDIARNWILKLSNALDKYV